MIVQRTLPFSTVMDRRLSVLLLSLVFVFSLGLAGCGSSSADDDDDNNGDTDTFTDGDTEDPCIYNCDDDDDDDDTPVDGDSDGDELEEEETDGDQPPLDGDEDCEGAECGFEVEEDDWEAAEQRDCIRDEDCLAGEYCDEDGFCQHAVDGDEEDDAEDDEYADYDLCDQGYPVCEWTPDCPEGHYCNQELGCCIFDCRDDEDCPGDDSCCITLYGICTNNQDVCNGGDEDEEIIECNSCADCPTGTYCDFNTDTCLPGECCLDSDCPLDGYWCDQGTCRSADSEINPYGRIRVNLCLNDLPTSPDQITVQLREQTSPEQARGLIRLNAKEVEPVAGLEVVREESAEYLPESGCFRYDFVELEQGHYFVTYYLNQPPGADPRVVYDWSGNFHYQLDEETCQFVLDEVTGQPVPILDGMVLDYSSPATTYYTVNIDQMVTNPLQQGSIQVQVVKGDSWSEPVTVELFENEFPTPDTPVEPMFSYQLDALESSYTFNNLSNGRYFARARSLASGDVIYDYYSAAMELNNCAPDARTFEDVTLYFGHTEQDLGSIQGTISFSTAYDPSNLRLGLYTIISVENPEGDTTQIYLLAASPVWGEPDMISNTIGYSFPNLEGGSYTLLGNYQDDDQTIPQESLVFTQSSFQIYEGTGNDSYNINAYLGVPNPNLGSISGTVTFTDAYDSAQMQVFWFDDDDFLSGSLLGNLVLNPDSNANQASYSINNLDDGEYYLELRWSISGPGSSSGFNRRDETAIVIDVANGQQDITGIDFILQ